jgi:hypothetical protein
MGRADPTARAWRANHAAFTPETWRPARCLQRRAMYERWNASRHEPRS